MDALGITIATPTNNAKAGTNKNKIEKLRKKREQRGDELRGAIKEINTLKQELFEIKKMIKEGFKK